jgi:nicotinamide riboside transporter PnuC
MISMWDTISQIAIFVLGIGSIVLIARKNKWGFVLGLLVQPFWFITSYINKQWGIFFLNFAYTATWIYGIYQWFYKDKEKK